MVEPDRQPAELDRFFAVSLILTYLFVFRFGGAPKKESLPHDDKTE